MPLRATLLIILALSARVSGGRSVEELRPNTSGSLAEHRIDLSSTHNSIFVHGMPKELGIRGELSRRHIPGTIMLEISQFIAEPGSRRRYAWYFLAALISLAILAVMIATLMLESRKRKTIDKTRCDGEYPRAMGYGAPMRHQHAPFAGYFRPFIGITEVKRSEQELKQLTGRLISAQEDERRRIARELHDDFSQQLTLVGLELAQLSVDPKHEPGIEGRVSSLEARIKQLSRAMNNRAHQLHSSCLETLGLVSAIHGFCREFSTQYAISVEFREHGIPFHMPSNISLCLFRIVQEGLQNVAKHSKAANCRVELTAEDGEVLLSITDSGVGFDPASLKRQTGFGLISMRERLRMVRGQVRLFSSPKAGTRLEIRVPVSKVAASA